MTTIVPNYYHLFHCIADKCTHTCCCGWEVDVDEKSEKRYSEIPEIKKYLKYGEKAQIGLTDEERCPFLNESGLCKMILKYGEEMLCQICRDHPRFRNYWTDCVEMGLGLVCEEAGRIILAQENPMKLVVINGIFDKEKLPEDEQYLMEVRESLLYGITQKGPEARLLEYLIYRHLSDALYDGRLEDRIRFIDWAYNSIMDNWDKSGKTFENLVECAREFSYEIEYGEGKIEKIMDSFA